MGGSLNAKLRSIDSASSVPRVAAFFLRGRVPFKDS